MRASEFIIERKKRSKKTRGLGGYFFPGYGFYGGDAGEGGGDGGGGESKNLGMAAGKIRLYTDPDYFGAEVADYQASGAVQNIPVGLLVGFEPDSKMAQPKSKANVEKIIAGIKRGDDIPPILVRNYKDGYQILDGHHRFRAYKLLGVKSIPAQVVPDSDIEEISKQGVAEDVRHSQDGDAVAELKAALLAKKDTLQAATDDQVYDIIDRIMTRIARSHSISGKKLHDMWVDKYRKIPDTWIMNKEKGVAEDAENFNGIDISIEVQGDEVMVRATASGRELGHVLFVEEDEYLMPQDLEVEERFQGQGIAAAMYDYVKSKGYKIRRSGQQTDAGAGFWGKHRPEQNVWENFADGRNPQDKGDSKRHGINTKASVSSLRKTAKQGGRKGQLAHWLANMKAGRAKAKKK